jgi:hypothetical protein
MEGYQHTTKGHYIGLDRDPRTAGFNYGRALGAPKGNAAYDEAVRHTQALGDVAMKFSAAQWRLEMATREVRNACSPEEQITALHELAVIRAEVDEATREVTGAHGRRWFHAFRFGRRHA